MRNPLVRLNIVLTLIGFAILVAAAVILHQLTTVAGVERRMLVQRPEIMRRVDQLFTDLRETENERARVRDLRPSPERLVRFVEGLERAAAGAFIEQDITTVPPTTADAGPTYNVPVVRYQVKLRGTLDKIETYLRIVHTLPELVRVESVVVQAAPDGNVVTNGEAKVTLAVAVSSSPAFAGNHARPTPGIPP